MAEQKNKQVSQTENKQTIKNTKTVYTFMFGRNIYTIRLSDIKKITLLEHVFSEREDDKVKVVDTLYIFSITGNVIPGQLSESGKPIYESIIELKASETDYISIYKIYEDIVMRWDAYRLHEMASSN